MYFLLFLCNLASPISLLCLFYWVVSLLSRRSPVSFVLWPQRGLTGRVVMVILIVVIHLVLVTGVFTGVDD